MAYKNVSIGIHSSFLTHFFPLQHWKLETKVYVSTYISAYINIYLLYVHTYRTIFCSNAEEHTVCYCDIAWLCSYVRSFHKAVFLKRPDHDWSKTIADTFVRNAISIWQWKHYLVSVTTNKLECAPKHILGIYELDPNWFVSLLYRMNF
jgi:hypothetical protein